MRSNSLGSGLALIAAVVLAHLAPVAAAEDAYRPSARNLEARRWFQDAKFGLFVHWGIYSTLADGEWVMQQRRIPIDAYERLAWQFNPTQFDPAEWVALAKAAGMRYITITSKHHDGFAMFDSRVSTYDVFDSTPYKRDVLKLLADECHKQGIKLFFYYSQLDWHHPDYFPRGWTGLDAGRPQSGEWSRYLDYMDAQLRELLTGYGEVGGIWFDGMWDKPDADWRLAETYRLIHELQPQALVGSNHHKRPYPGEDFQMFEKDLPGGNTAGFSADSELGDLPLETCETINAAWGFNLLDHRFKSKEELIRYLVRAAGFGANFLLNVGPMPNGKIQPEFEGRLRAVGQWLAVYGDAIYGTRGGPITPRPWGVTTQKDQRVFVHVLDWSDGALLLPALPRPVRAASLLKDGSPVRFSRTPDGTLLHLPARPAPEVDTVIVLDLSPR